MFKLSKWCWPGEADGSGARCCAGFVAASCWCSFFRQLWRFIIFQVRQFGTIPSSQARTWKKKGQCASRSFVWCFSSYNSNYLTSVWQPQLSKLYVEDAVMKIAVVAPEACLYWFWTLTSANWLQVFDTSWLRNVQSLTSGFECPHVACQCIKSVHNSFKAELREATCWPRLRYDIDSGVQALEDSKKLNTFFDRNQLKARPRREFSQSRPLSHLLNIQMHIALIRSYIHISATLFTPRR